jgi:hypothetical protein
LLALIGAQPSPHLKLDAWVCTIEAEANAVEPSVGVARQVLEERSA